jgi:hypothetical protein
MHAYMHTHTQYIDSCIVCTYTRGFVAHTYTYTSVFVYAGADFLTVSFLSDTEKVCDSNIQ